MKSLRIEPQKEGKGRTFVASLLAYVTADRLWEGGQTGAGIRPAFLMYAASDGEVRPFTANLRLGKKALVGSNTSYGRRKDPYFEVLRSADYLFSTQRFAEGSVVTAFLANLFQLDPGMVDPKGAGFVVLPSKEWVARQKIEIRPLVDHMIRLDRIESGKPHLNGDWPTLEQVERLALVASLFAAYLDRRTRAPLLQDSRFHLQILVSFLKHGQASISCDDSLRKTFGRTRTLGYYEEGLEGVGLIPGVAFQATHDEIEKVLAEEVSVFLQTTQP